MSNPEINRKIVQLGLDRRAAERREREAALEADAQLLRLKVNAHSRSHRERMEAAQAAERLQARNTAAAARRKERRDQAVWECQDCASWYLFMVKVTAPLIGAAAVLSLSTMGSVPIVLTAPFAIVGCMFSISDFAGRFLRK